MYKKYYLLFAGIFFSVHTSFGISLHDTLDKNFSLPSIKKEFEKIETKNLKTYLTAKDKEGRTPLMKAAIKNRPEVITFLLEKAKSLVDIIEFVNAKDKTNHTPIDYAVWYSTVNAVKPLVDNGADFTAPTVMYRISAITTAKRGKFIGYSLFPETTSVAMGKKAERFAKKIPATATSLAATRKKTNIIKFLKAAKKTNLCDKLKSLLFYEVNFNTLSSAGLDILLKKCPKALHYQDKDGNTPLLIAVEKNIKNMVLLLLQKGANINIKNKNDDSLLHIAIGKNLPDMLILLLQKGANANILDKNGNTPLQVALDIFRFKPIALKDFKIRLSEKNWLEYKNYLFHGINSFFTDYLKKEQNIKKEWGFYKKDDNSIIGDILNNINYNLKYYINQTTKFVDPFFAPNVKININKPNKEKNTALHIAVYTGNIDAIKKLLDRGADKNFPNYRGETPKKAAIRLWDGKYGIKKEAESRALAYQIAKGGATWNLNPNLYWFFLDLTLKSYSAQTHKKTFELLTK